MGARDTIGRRGEFLACTRLSDFCGNVTAYFNPHALGEKCPLFDLLVELEGLGKRAAYFFAQVKATRKGSAKRTTRLRVEVSGDHVQKMVQSPFPTYLIGVDEPRETAFIVSMHGNLAGPISSMPRRHPLTPRTLKALWEEVADYWPRLSVTAVRTSRFNW